MLVLFHLDTVLLIEYFLCMLQNSSTRYFESPIYMALHFLFSLEEFNLTKPYSLKKNSGRDKY